MATRRGNNGNNTINFRQLGESNDRGFDLGGSDKLLGGAGDDILRGGSGREDSLFGDAGDDSLFGEDGRDLLYGGIGADLLNGGRGRDVLTGGSGNDRFVFKAGKSNATNAGADIITDWAVASDFIDMSISGRETNYGEAFTTANISRLHARWPKVVSKDSKKMYFCITL